jgi:hypothetical protein
MIRSPFFSSEQKGISPCASSRIQPHDIVEGTRWRDPVTLTSRGVNYEMFARSVILTEERKIKEVRVGLYRKPVSFSQESAGVGLWPPVRRAYGSERYLPAIYV